MYIGGIMETAPAQLLSRSRSLSGRQWITQFEGSTSLAALRLGFRKNVEAFVAALREAGAIVRVTATVRTAERAYLMHWSWRIVKQGFEPQKVPEMRGVDIEWAHKRPDGSYSRQQSVAAAADMVRSFGIDGLGVAPALQSRHMEGRAVDMKIEWRGELAIKDAKGNVVRISTLPRSGRNSALHGVGATYGVIKYNRSGRDDPHWSDTGA
jgi:hypothetical protein